MDNTYKLFKHATKTQYNSKFLGIQQNREKKKKPKLVSHDICENEIF